MPHINWYALALEGDTDLVYRVCACRSGHIRKLAERHPHLFHAQQPAEVVYPASLLRRLARLDAQREHEGEAAIRYASELEWERALKLIERGLEESVSYGTAEDPRDEQMLAEGFDELIDVDCLSDLGTVYGHVPDEVYRRFAGRPIIGGEIVEVERTLWRVVGLAMYYRRTTLPCEAEVIGNRFDPTIHRIVNITLLPINMIDMGA